MIKLVLSFAIIANLFGCATYEKSVAARSVKISAESNGEDVGGKVIYSVQYK